MRAIITNSNTLRRMKLVMFVFSISNLDDNIIILMACVVSISNLGEDIMILMIEQYDN